MTATLQEPGPPSASKGGPAVLVASDYAQGSRTRRGERLDHVFEERCDWMRSYGRSDHLAVDTGDTVLTFGELDERANQLARHLMLACGARAGDRIALLFDQPLHSYIAMLAVLKINAAYVPLDVGFPADRLAYIVSDAGARLVLTLSHVRDRVEGLEQFAPSLLYVDQAARGIAARSTARLTDAERGAPVEDLAYLIYTSGTTGKPKGVAIEHTSICNFVRVAAEVYGVRMQDRVYQGMTIAFDFSVEEIWVPWVAGATLVPKPAGSSLLGLDLHAVPRRAPDHRAVLRADAAGHHRGRPARPAVPAGLRRGLPAGPDRPLAPARPALPQRLRPDRGHGHRDLDRAAPGPPGDHRPAAAHLHHGHPGPGRPVPRAAARRGRRDRHRRDRAGHRLPQPATT